MSTSTVQNSDGEYEYEYEYGENSDGEYEYEYKSVLVLVPNLVKFLKSDFYIFMLFGPP